MCNAVKSIVLTQPNSVIRFTVITRIQGSYVEKAQMIHTDKQIVT